jgi:hypothetical protein
MTIRGHILRFARDGLLKEPISGLPGWYSKMFLRLVESAGSDRKLVQSATLTLTYDFLSSIANRALPCGGKRLGSSVASCPFKCLGIGTSVTRVPPNYGHVSWNNISADPPCFCTAKCPERPFLVQLPITQYNPTGNTRT